MSATKYTYTTTKENGWELVKLTREEHKDIFPKRPLRWHTKYECYISEKSMRLEQHPTHLAVVVHTLLFPINLLVYGLGNFKDLLKEYGDLYHTRERGKFTSDEVWRTTETYRKVREAHNGR